MDGVGLVSCDVFLVGGAVPVFWLMELALISLKGSAVSSNRFWSVYGFSMPLGSPSSIYGVAAAAVKSLQSCPTLCDPIDGSPPGSPVPHVYIHSCFQVVLSA